VCLDRLPNLQAQVFCGFTRDDRGNLVIAAEVYDYFGHEPVGLHRCNSSTQFIATTQFHSKAPRNWIGISSLVRQQLVVYPTPSQSFTESPILQYFLVLALLRVTHLASFKVSVLISTGKTTLPLSSTLFTFSPSSILSLPSSRFLLSSLTSWILVHDKMVCTVRICPLLSS